MDEPSTSKHFLVYCCNPFNKLGHDYHKKNLRSVNKNILRHNANLREGDKICDGCRKATLKLPEILIQHEGLYSDSSESQDDLNVPEVPLTPEKLEAIAALNKSLTAIEETPIKRKRLTEKHYPETKIKKVAEAFRTKILNLNPSTSESDTAKNYDSEIIDQLKEKFNDTTDKSVRMQILTTLPKSWTLICKIPTPKCYFTSCINCPGSDDLKARFEEAFELNSIEHVSFKQWMQIDNKCVLETIIKSTEEFLDHLFQNLPKLLRHSFIATQQSSYLRHLKENLPQNQCIVLFDFSENYAFILQDAAQGYHWNNAQATIHPFVIYYVDEETKKLMHLSLVIISDCMMHDTVAVHLFQRLMIDFLKQNLSHKPEKLNYFSDGAASQYKNKSNFLNLCNHEKDFGIKAEWNFFASSHGKNACDGVGGTVKRLAALASLRMVYNDQIMTPRQLYNWAKKNVTNINFLYSTKDEYEAEEKILKTRFEAAIMIKGTRQFHSYSPVNETRILVKTYSFSQESTVEIVSADDSNDDLEINDIVGFVTCQYSDKWWLGCVLEVEGDNVKINFLEPHGPSTSFKYPQFTDILIVHKKEVLTKVDPTTATGRVYQLTDSEMHKANKKLSVKLKKT